jgi:hypothetical protein
MQILLHAKLQFLAIAVSPTSHSSSRPRISVRPAGAVRIRRMTALLTALFPHDRPGFKSRTSSEVCEDPQLWL